MNPWESEPHRFVVEELLDGVVVVVKNPNSRALADGTASGSVPSEVEQEVEKKIEVPDNVGGTA
jgi:hypothetical protein